MGLRLDTKLSRLLLDEGKLVREALEDAVQQQVVHGGALDTLLLELHLVSEADIADALVRSWDCAPVSRKEREDPDALAITRLPSRMAVAMGLCPFKLDEDGLHVMVAAPVDQELLSEVGGLCGFELVPHVVCEVRLHQALHRAYGVTLEDRYAALLAQLDGEDAAVTPIRESLFHDQTEIRPPDASAELRPAATTSEGERADISPAAAASWDIVEALAHLAAQDRREGIAQVAVSFALRFVPFAAVFGVRAGHAVGWHRAGPCEGTQFHAVQLKVPKGSVAAQILSSPSPLIGKPPINDGNTQFLTWLGRRRPRTSLLIPIVVARRTVGILYADGGVRARDIQALSDLVAFGARIGPAFEALLRARHRAHADLFPGRPAATPTKPGSRKLGAGALDGTSPFARNYTGPIVSPPTDEGRAVTDEQGMRPVGAQSEDDVAALAASFEMPDDSADDDDASVRITVRTANVDAVATAAPPSSEDAFGEGEDTVATDLSSDRANTQRMEVPAETRGPQDRSDEEDVAFDGALDGNDAAATIGDDGGLLATANASALRSADADAFESPNDELSADAVDRIAEQEIQEFERTASGRRRRAPLMFDDRTEELSLERQRQASQSGEASSSLEREELVFPEYPRESASDEAWTGALSETVARGQQGGAPPAPSDDVELSDFGLPDAPPAEPLPHASPEIEMSDFDALSSPPQLAPTPLPLPQQPATFETLKMPALATEMTGEAIPADISLADIEPPALVPLPEVEALHDSAPPRRTTSGAFSSLIEEALPVDVETAPTVEPQAAPPPVLDDAIELHTGDVDVSHSLVDDGPYLDDVLGDDPPLSANIIRGDSIPPVPGEDDPNATQQIGVDDASDAELVEDLGSLQPERVKMAQAALLLRGASAREAIRARFPGRLLVDVFGENVAPNSPQELGPLVEVTVQMGKEGVLCAAAHLKSEFPAHRYAAVFTLRALGDDRNIDLLPPVLQDSEPRVRQLAGEALLAHVAHPRFESVLKQLRPLLDSPAPGIRSLGAAHLGRFKDVAAVPRLIALVDDKSEQVRSAAVRALNEISLQDAGTKAKAWKKWWDKARKLTRIDWLIEGLRSPNRALRRQAIGELRAIVGDDYGFRVDDTKRQRDAAASKFQQWWAQQRAAR